MMAVRMNDIALAVGVSTETVSKVLNNDPNMSVRREDRVLACAKKLELPEEPGRVRACDWEVEDDGLDRAADCARFLFGSCRRYLRLL